MTAFRLRHLATGSGLPGRWTADLLWECQDRRRERTVPCALYLPKSNPGTWIVFSTGFGGSRFDYFRLAKGWSQAGYGVVIVEHPGSARLAALRLLPTRYRRPGPGLRPLVYNQRCLRNRPQDLHLVVERLLATFRVNKLIMAGHSYGEYSAAAVAGLPALTEPGPTDFSHPRVEALMALSFQPPGQLFRSRDYAKLKIPALWLVAEHDHTADGTRCEQRLDLEQLIAGTVVVLPDTDHLDLADMGTNRRATEPLLQVTIKFLRGLSKAESVGKQV